MKTLTHNFVTHLETLAEDRAALAALRRGLGQPPGAVPDMYPYVIPWLPKEAYPNSWNEQSYYLVAALYALHPASTADGNLGDHFAHTLDPNPERNAATERRFTALLTAHADDLADYLRHAISFLKAKEQPINWHELMWNVRDWGHPERQNRVQKRWATQFWRRRDEESPAPDTNQGDDDSDE